MSDPRKNNPKSHQPITLVFILGLGTWMAFGSGCVTEEVVDPYRPFSEDTMVVTRTGEDVSMSWNSEKDNLYTITYADKLNPAGGWKALPGWIKVPGTGERMVATDRVSLNEDRRYQLSVFPQKKRLRDRNPP